MQATCSQCASRIQVDDSKVPDRPFKVKCPKCQALITLPGKSTAAPAESEAASGAEAPAAPPPPPAYVPPPPPPSAAAVARRERASESQNDAIVALAPGPASTALQGALVSLGFNVDAVDDIEEGARLVEQGVYEVAAPSRPPAEPGKPETLAQRLLRLPTDSAVAGSTS